MKRICTTAIVIFCSVLVLAQGNPELKKTLKDFSVEKDKVEGITWYTSKKLKTTTPDEAIRQYARSLNTITSVLTAVGKQKAGLKYASSVYLYLGQKGESAPWGKFVIEFQGNDWLFMKKVKFVIDGVAFEKDLPDVKTKTVEGGVREQQSMSLTKELADLSEKIASSKETIIRFYGSEGQGDHTITKAEKSALKSTLDLFSKLGGKPN